AARPHDEAPWHSSTPPSHPLSPDGTSMLLALAQHDALVHTEVAPGVIGVRGEHHPVSHRHARCLTGRTWSDQQSGQPAAATDRAWSSRRVVTVSAASATLVFHAVTRG